MNANRSLFSIQLNHHISVNFIERLLE